MGWIRIICNPVAMTIGPRGEWSGARHVGYNPKMQAGSVILRGDHVEMPRWGGSRRPSLRWCGQSADASLSPSVPLPRGEREEGGERLIRIRRGAATARVANRQTLPPHP